MAKPYALANQKLCYIQVPLNIEKSGEQDKEKSREWLVNTGPGKSPRSKNENLRILLPVVECLIKQTR